jgi:hypothetical protein
MGSRTPTAVDTGKTRLSTGVQCAEHVEAALRHPDQEPQQCDNERDEDRIVVQLRHCSRPGK